MTSFDHGADRAPGDATRVVRAGPARGADVRADPARPGLRRPLPSARRRRPARTPTAATTTRPGPLLERAIGELEAPGQDDVETLVFASGMAAISAVLFSQLRAGRHRRPARRRLPGAAAGARAAGGVRHRGAHRADRRRRPARVARRRDAAVDRDAVQPGPRRVRHPRLAEAAHARGALVAVDNTLATPLGQRPLELGADFSVASGTKELTGHGDMLLGYVAGADAALAAPYARGARSPARSPARWRHGSRTARSPRSTCASTGRPPPR